MPSHKKKVVTPQTNESSPRSLPTPAPPSPAGTAKGSSNSSSNPSGSDSPASYSPPGAPPIPSSPLTSTDANPSSSKSSTASKPPKTPPSQSPPKPSVEPKKHPVLGTGGAEYLIFAAATFSDEKFAEYYTHRADHLLVLHAEAEGAQDALARLETLIQ